MKDERRLESRKEDNAIVARKIITNNQEPTFLFTHNVKKLAHCKHLIF